jgi:RHH-type proline utilization regulon transcriptional repressor/proline dehydrogenase/delta 1-pyrroline-5-carboxylate dehydrogenase
MTMRTCEAQSALPRFAAPYSEAEEAIAPHLLAAAEIASPAQARVDALAERLVTAIRTKTPGFGALEDVLREYSLSSKEGLALMVLAEALLRVPDNATADRLIEDKLAHPGWARHTAISDTLLVSASIWTLSVTARLLQKGETAQGILAATARRIGMSALRPAACQAIQIMGAHFVLGRTIEEGLAQSTSREGRLFRYSFDMLGEGARTSADAAHYNEAYAQAIEAIGRSAGAAALPERPGISVKLSALHPRFEASSRARVMNELVPRVRTLAQRARKHELNFTIDAEEADRLELSLDVFAAVLDDPALEGWAGFGLAVQAYQKRASAVLDYVFDLARHYDRHLMVRLVKGAYWDTEIKRAQERGLADYPVFTRKAMTDLNYLACARQLLDARDRIFPQFATHNALTVASIVDYAGGVEGYEFQRLHGMGSDLFAALRQDYPDAACRIYAPVGGYRDLLAYLVRRLLENGANSSFVARIADSTIPLAVLLQPPQKTISDAPSHKPLPLPEDLQGPSRKSAKGFDFGDRQQVDLLLHAIRTTSLPARASSIVNGHPQDGPARPVISPIDGRTISEVSEASPDLVEKTVAIAQAACRAWSSSSIAERALCLEKMSDALEAERPRFLALLQSEAGKTLDDALGELREAVDFCRYYAADARQNLASPETMPGPTGEENRLTYVGRGVFICISPWNFPLSIFLGQVAAALVSGNTVIAKPAEQTPLLAAETIALLHRCGVPVGVLHLLLGAGDIGAALVASPHVAGVVFTGSTETAFSINRQLASKTAAIVPFIAETGGINAMIVDATALPEQVTDDVITSSFRSAGQRCSALRLLCVQEDVADTMFSMIAGAAVELAMGDPRDLAVHVGPVIDAAAQMALEAHISKMKQNARVHFAGTVPASLSGFYVAPHMFEIASVADLEHEVFGPVLHVIRFKGAELDALLDAIGAMGYGLTLGIHSRIDATIEHIVARHLAGNVYVNRSMIGAVVGTQPFGGFALSGTGPKAGGPNYLKRFMREEIVSINTAAAGGNASLMTQLS